MLEKLNDLTDEQKQELNKLTTAEEVAAFAERAGVALTPEEAAEIAAVLPDEALGDVTGGLTVPIVPIPRSLY